MEWRSMAMPMDPGLVRPLDSRKHNLYKETF